MKNRLLAMFPLMTFFITIDNAVSLKPNSAETTSMHLVKRFFEVQTTPIVRVCQIPADNVIILDGTIAAQSIGIANDTYNRIPLLDVLYLKHDMTKEQIEAALHTAFGYDTTIICEELRI